MNADFDSIFYWYCLFAVVIGLIFKNAQGAFGGAFIVGITIVVLLVYYGEPIELYGIHLIVMTSILAGGAWRIKNALVQSKQKRK